MLRVAETGRDGGRRAPGNHRVTQTCVGVGGVAGTPGAVPTIGVTGLGAGLAATDVGGAGVAGAVEPAETAGAAGLVGGVPGERLESRFLRLPGFLKDGFVFMSLWWCPPRDGLLPARGWSGGGRNRSPGRSRLVGSRLQQREINCGARDFVEVVGENT